MKLFITKYALTEGIQEFEGEITDTSLSMVMVPAGNRRLSQFFHGEGREWHRTRESAVARALVMRQNKIVSLNKKIKKLIDMKF
jgi:hypothetical protein